MEGLYIHIPFCKEICSYCDFFKRVPKDLTMQENYIKTLIKELNNYDLNNIDTIYIGGGTPNALDLNLLESFLINLNNKIDHKQIKEFTIELNLKYINQELLEILIKNHINRLSIGVETLNLRLGAILNRVELFTDLKEKLVLIQKLGIKNVNLDFIFGIPSETFKELKYNLKKIKEIRKYITHISYYNLILEEKTKLFYDINIKKKYQLLNPDIEAKYFLYIVKYLKRIGFNHYEISNFSKNGYKSIHNLKYWNSINYIGLGAGASGFIFPLRYDNIRNVEEYIKYGSSFNMIREETLISKEELLKEKIILGLRKIEGININDLNNDFKIDFFKDYEFINDYLKTKYMKYKKGYLFFTEKGLLIQNQILKRFI